MIENLKDGTKLPSGMMESHCFGKIWDACDFGRRVLSPLVSLFPHLTSSLCGTLFPCLIAMEDDTSVIQQNRNYILATCTALGGYEEKETAPGVIKQVYTLGDQALGNWSMVPFSPGWINVLCIFRLSQGSQTSYSCREQCTLQDVSSSTSRL